MKRNKVIIQRCYKQLPAPKFIKHPRWTAPCGSPYIILRRESSQNPEGVSTSIGSRPCAASNCRVGVQQKAIDPKNHFATGLEYSGPFSVVVTLDDPADVTLLYEERFVGWSSISLCLSGAAGLCPSSANLFKMFIIVGTNFVDSERRAGSCVPLQAPVYKKIRRPHNRTVEMI